ncbi:MAG: hypothetical protein U0414_43260 [Polyangiaceae bacterium]
MITLSALSWCACNGEPPEPSLGADPTLEALRRFEVQLRASTPLGHEPPSDRRLGPIPHVVARLGEGFVGLARGASRLVVFDRAFHEVARARVAPGSDALAVRHDGAILVASESRMDVQVFQLAMSMRTLEALDPIALPRSHKTSGVRALATHESGAVYAIDALADELFVIGADGRVSLPIPVPAGPIRLAVTPRRLVVASLVGHALAVFRLTADGDVDGEPAVTTIDGPFWGVTAEEREGALRVAAGGAEDHPLDRTGGSFGYVDSFVYLYGEGAARALVRERAIDVSELGVVTPKALAFEPSGALLVTGYGSARAARIGPDHSTTVLDLPPGSASITALADGSFAIANPLVDAWIRLGARDVVDTFAEPAIAPRTEGSRVGEALVFTTLMAPWQTSEGERSRFTCETCHFEGFGDARVHATGRGAVTATTKPLYGLFDNEPHFTRALDEDLATMIVNEFRVASSRSDHAPVFSLAEAEVSPAFPSGLAWLGLERPIPTYDALFLRRSLLEFLRDLSPRENPHAAGRDAFSGEERRGSEVFARECASCHAPRLRASDPSTEVPFAEWKQAIFSGGAIVWGRSGYERTGIEPYVHEEGARPSSLRRIGLKRPYFTNGSSATLADVLDRFRVVGEGTDARRGLHASSEGQPLPAADRTALEAFLRTL